MAAFVDRIPNSNCTISYSVGGDYHSLGVKVQSVGKGYTPIYTESHARSHKAMYPMQKALTPFYVQLLCNGYKEFTRCQNFFLNYMHLSVGDANSALEAAMTVLLYPFKNAENSFFQQGVPISGIESGDHVGSMLFTPTIQFESYFDPNDTTIWNSSGGFEGASYEVFGSTNTDDAGKFFYPRSAGSIDPTAKGQSLYDSPHTSVTEDNGAILGDPSSLAGDPQYNWNGKPGTY